MILQAFASGPFATNAYVLGCEKTKRAAIIDPAPESAQDLLEFLKKEKLVLDKILLTHSHWDHIADIQAVDPEHIIPIFVHEADAPNLREPGADGLPIFGLMDPLEPDEDLADGQRLKVGEIELQVLHTPGHTPGGVCFYIPSEQTLISGDTLFQGSIGRLDFPTGDAPSMWRSLKRLAELAPETKVYPGHGDPTTIGAESWLSEAQKIFG